MSKSKHPRAIRARKWRASNPQSSAASSRKWRKKHPRYWRQWRFDNRDKKRQHDRTFKAKNPNYARDSHLRRTYGITLVRFNAELKAQKGRCAACNRKFSEHTMMTKVGVDHCHKTGEFRALLCRGCNLTLGMVDDSTELLELLIQYLKAHQNGRHN